MAELSMVLLGPPQVKIDDLEIHMRRRKALAVLIYLVVSNKTHSRETLWLPPFGPSMTTARRVPAYGAF